MRGANWERGGRRDDVERRRTWNEGPTSGEFGPADAQDEDRGWREDRLGSGAQGGYRATDYGGGGAQGYGAWQGEHPGGHPGWQAEPGAYGPMHQTPGGVHDSTCCGPERFAGTSGREGMTFVPGGTWGGGGTWVRGGWEHNRQQIRGRPPKNYKRSDERIREEICDALMQQPGVDVSDVEVKVSNGEVTLAGTVPERRLKHEVEDLAENRLGVTEVHNELKVRKDAFRESGFRSGEPTGGRARETSKNR